jgi:signal transduction protein with GAF and PtsI domain
MVVETQYAVMVMAWQQTPTRSLNEEETKALSIALDSLATLIADLVATNHLHKDNARIGIRQLTKTHPTTRSLGVSEATLANLVAMV